MDPADSATTCNLAPTVFRKRLQWIEQLNVAALRRYHREGARIELTYDPAATTRIGDLVRRERECCPFLDFTVDHGENAVVVTIQASADLAAAADELFIRRPAT